MKKSLLFTAITFFYFSSIVSAQENTAAPKTYMGHIEFGGGVGYTAKSNNLYRIVFSYNSLIKEKYLVGLNTAFAFEPSFTGREFSNHVNNYMLYYISFGVRNKVGKVYFTPSIGIGQTSYKLTGFDQEEVAKISLTSTAIDIETKKKYNLITEKQITVPINLNILLTGKYTGVGLNFYIIASKYTEMGAGITFNLGKVK